MRFEISSPELHVPKAESTFAGAMRWSFTTTLQTGPKEIVGVVLFNRTGFILFLPQWSKSTYNPHLTHAVTANAYE